VIPLERDLTVTGSMTFAGGPFNNYVIQATCRIAELLRAGRGRHGLVSSVSGVLTKQGIGLWSREPARDGFALRDVTDEVAHAVPVKRVVESATGSATIAGYTVLHERGRPPRGVAIVDVGDARTVVDTVDGALVAQMESAEMCGAPVHLRDDHAFVLTS
jgi:acetyl-CoA C-acetyltransferase